MPELTYTVNIDTRLALQSLRQLHAELSRDILRGRIKGVDVSGLEQQLARTRAALGEISFGNRFRTELAEALERIPLLGGAFRAVNGMIGSATAAAAGFSIAAGVAVKALRGWAEEERSIMAVNAALAATGQLSPEAAASLNALAGSLQRATNIDDSAWRDSFAMLIRLGGVSANEMERHAKIVQGLAGLIGTDLSTATMLYVRALNGHFEALSRYGIALKEGASDAEKLAAIQERGAAAAGLITAQTQTLSGAWASLRHSIHDAWKALGEFIDKGWGVTPKLKAISDFIRNILPQRLEPDTSALQNVANTAATVEENLRKVGLAANQLKTFGAAPEPQITTEWEQATQQLKAELDLRRARIQIERDRQLAELKLEETLALSRTDITPAQEQNLKAEFAARRAGITATAALQLQQTEQEITQRHLNILRQERSRRYSAVAEVEQQYKAAEAGLQRAEEKVYTAPRGQFVRAVEAREHMRARVEELAATLQAARERAAELNPIIEQFENRIELLNQAVRTAEITRTAEVAEAARKYSTQQPQLQTERILLRPAEIQFSAWQRMGALGGLLPGADYARQSAHTLQHIARRLDAGITIRNLPANQPYSVAAP
ncbi:MAG: hypothetical protein N3B01_10620 [Verrucomicrobiae bacterium]|nr:hypothetical protein [Verrucomicrobiae bacterium]